MLYAELTESVLDVPLYPEPTVGSPWLCPQKKFQNGGSQMAKKRYFEIDLCTYSIL